MVGHGGGLIVKTLDVRGGTEPLTQDGIGFHLYSTEEIVMMFNNMLIHMDVNAICKGIPHKKCENE